MKLRKRTILVYISHFINKMCCLRQLWMSSITELLYFVIGHGLLVFILCACYFETLKWLWILLCFVNILLLVRSLEDKLVFYNEEPSDARTFVDPPSMYGIPAAAYEEFYLRTNDGVRLHCYFLKYRSGQVRPEWTLLFLHGNAGNIGHRLVNGAQLSEACSANVLLLDYRGYGLSDGRPSERGMYRDAETALAFLANAYPVSYERLRHRTGANASSASAAEAEARPKSKPNSSTVTVDDEAGQPQGRSAYLAELQVDTQRIGVYGQSIGGAVSVYLASQDCALRSHVAALLLENTFTSLPELGKLLFRSAVPLVMRIPNVIVKNQFGSLKRIGAIRCPILFISGSNDQLVPPGMMYALHERAREARIRRLLKFARGTHNDTWLSPGYYPALTNFLVDAARFTSAS